MWVAGAGGCETPEITKPGLPFGPAPATPSKLVSVNIMVQAPVVNVALIGARQHYAVPRAFQSINRLGRFLPDMWVPPALGNWLKRFGGSLGRRLAGRFHPELDPMRVQPVRRMSAYNALGSLHTRGRRSPYEFYCRQGAMFSRAVNHRLERTLADQNSLFFGFTSTCLETLEYLADKQIPTITDQIDPLCTEFRIVARERERWPDWEPTSSPVPDAYVARVKREWDLATHVLVNSEWTKRALVEQGVNAKKIMVVPLAYEGPIVSKERFYDESRPLRVLWLGSVILRKGIQYLCEAARCLQDVATFRIVGPIKIAREKVDAAPKNMVFEGSTPRSEAGRSYDWADVFVLPTLSDGFAITQLEALAHGVPVVATPNCGEVVVDGKHGRIVPVADADALAAALLDLARQPDVLRSMSQNCLERVRDFTLDRFANRVLSRISS